MDANDRLRASWWRLACPSARHCSASPKLAARWWYQRRVAHWSGGGDPRQRQRLRPPPNPMTTTSLSSRAQIVENLIRKYSAGELNGSWPCWSGGHLHFSCPASRDLRKPPSLGTQVRRGSGRGGEATNATIATNERERRGREREECSCSGWWSRTGSQASGIVLLRSSALQRSRPLSYEIPSGPNRRRRGSTTGPFAATTTGTSRQLWHQRIGEGRLIISVIVLLLLLLLLPPLLIWLLVVWADECMLI